MATSLQKAEADRVVMENKIDFIERRVNLNPTNPLSLQSCNDLLKRLTTLEDHLDEIHRRICNAFPDDITPHTTKYQELHTKIFNNKETLYQIRSLIPTPSSTNTNNSTVQEIKLPRLELPQFSGDIQEWISFKDMFLAAVHNQSTLSKVQKFTYLIGSLSGEAAKIIQSLPLSEENYDIAWDALQDRYNNERELLFTVLKRLFNQTVINPNNPASVRNLIDQTKASVRSFNLLKGNIEHIFMYLTFLRLDPSTRELWYQTSNPKTIPTVTDLYSFLEQRALALSMGASNGRARVEKPKTQSHHTQQQQPVNLCIMKCDSTHPLFRCPAFLKLTVPKRLEQAKNHKLCNNCLRGNHSTNNCNSQRTCHTCQQSHHTLLHNSPQSLHGTFSNNSSVAATHQPEAALLATAVVSVQGQFGEVLCRSLLDSGASNSFITTTMARKLGLQINHSDAQITGMASVAVGPATGITNITFSPHFSSHIKFEIQAFVIPRITSKQPQQRLQLNGFSHLTDLQLADPSFHIPAQVDLLIGSDLFWEIIRSEKTYGDTSQPIAVNSVLGWLVAGKGHKSSNIISHISNVELNSQLERFWRNEDIPELFSIQEQQCEDIFSSSLTQDNSGRFTVAIPWKSSRPQFGESRSLAYKRLTQMEKRLASKSKKFTEQQNQHFKNEYINFMREYQELGHMSPVPVEEILSPRREVYYIPHHFVLKEDSSTTKFRVVFDGSAKSSNGVSLNSAMMVGPTVQSTLFAVLLRFRLHPIVFTTDIAKMYRQIRITEDDADLHRILWRENSTDPVQEFRLNTVTYGTAAAPYLATRTLLQLANINKTKYPLASATAARDAYVDDIQSGSQDVETAIQTVSELTKMCSSACFPLRKWTSNSQSVLNTIPIDLRETQSVVPIGNEEDPQTVKTLGIYWKPSDDCYLFKVNLPENPAGKYTKRTIISEMSKLFDPLGWLTPITLRAKLLMQEIWKTKLDWDEPQPSNIQTTWKQYKRELSLIEQLTIPRLILTKNSKYQLVGFSDASEKGIAAVVYVASTQYNQLPIMRLLTSKSKVAPATPISLPRLELNAAVLLSKLLTTVHLALEFTFDDILGFTDSTITLGWINSDPNRWKTYVRNRVAKIQSAKPQISWYHVKGENNPADIASRGIHPQEILSHSLWWNGNPHVLTTYKSNQTQFDLSLVAAEEKHVVQCNHTDIKQFQFISTFSSLHRLQKFTALLIRAQRNFKSRKTQTHEIITGPYSCDELEEALLTLVSLVQHNSFLSELQCLLTSKQLPTNSKLLSLNPFVDNRGLLRVGGRLSNATISPEAKHPLLLPRNNHLTNLIINQIHIRNLHSGNQLTLSILNQRFWVVRGRDAVRQILRKCVICTRQRAITVQQLMGQLPPSRVTPTKAFQQCGVDYAGPFTLRNSGRSKVTTKSYLSIFICFVTRAIHLEIAGSLSTDSFIGAFRRFISRRGKPTDMHSDCGTNFVGANKELSELHRAFQQDKTIIDTFAAEGIRWHFNPPGAPHFGGLWEAGVKSVKYHLHRVMGPQHFTFEEFSTLTTQIEGILNSRPLTPISTDPSDLQVLTPAHFLIGGPLVGIPEPSLHHININRLDRWQMIQAKQQSFWKRWSSEYITRLQQRPKWMKSARQLKENDIVIIKEDNLPPARWKLGRVIALHPGTDNIIRVVTLKTSHGEVKRPVTKLCLLPIDDEGSM